MPKVNPEQMKSLQLDTLLMTVALGRLQIETMKWLAAKGALTKNDVSLIFDAVRVDLMPVLPGDDMPGVAESHLRWLAEEETEVMAAAPAIQ